MNLHCMEKNLTEGSIVKNVVAFSLPYLLSYFLQTLYGMADLFIIGQFEGVDATTAVSVGSQIMHVLTVTLVGLAMGATVSIGQSVGAGNKRESALNIGNTVTLFMSLSVVLTVLLLCLVRPIVSAMSTPTEAVDGTIRYLVICFIGIPCIVAYNITASIFRGMGDSKTPMYFIAVACVVNIVLDYVFMGAMHLGPIGAAFGTIIAQAVSVALSLWVIRRQQTGIVLARADFKPQRQTLGKILSVGIPVSLQEGFIQISFLIITIIANRRGLTDAAAVGIVEKIMSFMFLVPSSMMSTVAALGAQNIGAQKPERAVATLKCAICIAFGLGLIIASAVTLSAVHIVSLFTADSLVAVAGAQYLRGYVLDSVFGGVQFSFSGYFNAIRRSELSFLHNILSIIFVRVPGAYFASKFFPDNLFPMGLASTFGSLLSVAVCLIAFALIRRKPAKS